MANPELGTKQVCPSCQSKFYDLGRRPAHCPKCGADFDPEEANRSRRVRARSSGPDYEADDEAPAKAASAEGEEGFEEQDQTPEIDEAAEADAPEGDEAEEGGATPGAEPDLGVDFEEEAEEGELEADSEDVPFLEEEEGFGQEEVERPGKDEDR